LDSVDVVAMSPTQVSRWTMYARYGFMELRIKEAVWRFESVYASVFDKRSPWRGTRDRKVSTSTNLRNQVVKLHDI